MEDSLMIRRYLLMARRWWWLVVLCAIVAAVASFFISSQATPVYQASTTLLVRQAADSNLNEYNALLLSERLMGTYAEMLEEGLVFEDVVDQLSLAVDPEDLAERISARQVGDTQVLRLSVEDTDPVRAARIADGVAEAFVVYNGEAQQERYAGSLEALQAQIVELSALIDETSTRLEEIDASDASREEEKAQLEAILASYRNTHATLLQSYEEMHLTAVQSYETVSVLKRATVPRTPKRPRTATNTMLAGAVGAMLAVGVAFLVEYLDDTIKIPEDVNQVLGLSTLGVIGRFKKGADELAAVSEPLSPVSEAFRMLRTNIRYSGVDEPIRTLLVTSAGPTEGKSITVANLGVAMAQGGLKVVAVDADLRRPRLHKLFRLRVQGGLTGSLLEGTMDGRLQPSEVEGLVVLPSGALPPNPVDLLGSKRLQELLQVMAQHMDMVLIDSPPVLPVADAVVLAQLVDGVLLVLDAGETRRDVAQRAVESLRQVDANLIGVVLNRVPSRRGSGYYYYYRHYYGNYDGNGQKRKRRGRRA